MAALDTVVRFAVMAPRRLPRKIAHLFGGIKGELRPDPDTFDQRTGLETAKLVHIYEADSINRNYVHSMGYEASQRAGLSGLDQAASDLYSGLSVHGSGMRKR